jgi:hypothetical protein
MSDLVELAKELVEVDQRAEEIRNAMRKLLANGPGETPSRPTRPRGAPWGAKRAAILAHSAAEDTRVVELLKATPLRQSAIAATIGAKPSTMQQRLRRLAEKGLVARNEDGLWSATSTPS